MVSVKECSSVEIVVVDKAIYNVKSLQSSVLYEPIQVKSIMVWES